MKKVIMAIGIGIVGSFCLPFANAQVGTNSWKSGSGSFWDLDTAWSLSVAPSISDIADFITNATTKTVTIDSSVGSDALTISNLTIGGIGSTTNTLFLKNMGTNVLHVLNGMAVTNNGILQITNSILQVDGAAGRAFLVNGSLQILNKAKVQLSNAVVSSSAVLQFALGTNSIPVAVSNNLAVAGMVSATDAGGFTTNTYTLFACGGSLTDNGLTLGSVPAGYNGVLNNTATQVRLIVTYQPIGANFSASPTNGVAPLPVTFTDTSTGIITNRFWDFGDSGTTNIVTNTVVHTYSNAGPYNVSLTACGLAGCSTIIQSNLITVVSPLTPFQQWQLQYFGCTNLVTCPQAAGDADPDGDGMSNTNEFLASFNPTNNAAYLHVISIVKTNSDVQVIYLGANGNPPIASRTNVLEFTAGVLNGNYSNNFVSTGQTNILSGGTGLGVVTNMVDTGGATNTPSRFYRVRVLVP
jgi:PKD repeat protein